MLVISCSFALLSVLLSGCIIDAKPHSSPLERRMTKNRRRNVLGSSPSPPPINHGLVGRDDSDVDVVWVDVTSFTTVTAQATATAAETTAESTKDEDAPEIVGAVLAGEGGSSGDDEPEVVYVDVTSYITKTAYAAEQTQQQQQQPATSTAEATRTYKKPVTVAAVAISTGPGGTTTLEVTSTQAATSLASATGKPKNDDESHQRWVDLHNVARQKYQVPPVVHAPELLQIAKEHAEACNKEHTKAAENLQWGSGMGTPDSAVNGWMSEDVLYDWNNPHYTDEAGHFTQAVWKNTSRIACWIAECSRGTVVGWEYEQSFQTACEYDPSGNYVGEENFRENVLPPAY
ncbi:uncharacterized protein IL334_005878 [Kwoniella shivajii]|uniref:SCP domain-containing protein n=1 Tax=Kwoniella shivajii TaxID=564305 RepID=A0ABZ1D4Y0_9TREE|nr:hypothetical protein IL334_005878 [Kwoniella shivajii]